MIGIEFRGQFYIVSNFVNIYKACRSRNPNASVSGIQDYFVEARTINNEFFVLHTGQSEEERDEWYREFTEKINAVQRNYKISEVKSCNNCGRFNSDVRPCRDCDGDYSLWTPL